MHKGIVDVVFQSNIKEFVKKSSYLLIIHNDDLLYLNFIIKPDNNLSPFLTLQRAFDKNYNCIDLNEIYLFWKSLVENTKKILLGSHKAVQKKHNPKQKKNRRIYYF